LTREHTFHDELMPLFMSHPHTRVLLRFAAKIYARRHAARHIRLRSSVDAPL